MLLLSILIIITIISIILIILGKCQKINYGTREDLKTSGITLLIFTVLIGWLIIGMAMTCKTTETTISKKDLTIQIVETKVVVVNKIDNTIEYFSDTEDYLIIKDSLDFDYVEIKNYNLYTLIVNTKYKLRKK